MAAPVGVCAGGGARVLGSLATSLTFLGDRNQPLYLLVGVGRLVKMTATAADADSSGSNTDMRVGDSAWQALSVTDIIVATSGPWPLCGLPRHGVLSSEVAVSTLCGKMDQIGLSTRLQAVLGPGVWGLGRGGAVDLGLVQEARDHGGEMGR